MLHPRRLASSGTVISRDESIRSFQNNCDLENEARNHFPSVPGVKRQHEPEEKSSDEKAPIMVPLSLRDLRSVRLEDEACVPQ